MSPTSPNDWAGRYHLLRDPRPTAWPRIRRPLVSAESARCASCPRLFRIELKDRSHIHFFTKPDKVENEVVPEATPLTPEDDKIGISDEAMIVGQVDGIDAEFGIDDRPPKRVRV